MRAYDGELGAAVARAQHGAEAAFTVAYRLVQPGLLGYLRDATPEETAPRHLSTAAGGRNRVAAYCAEQLTGERSAPNKPAGPDRPGEHTEGRKHSSGAHSARPGNGSIGADAGDVQPTAGNSPENGSKEGSRNRP